MSSLLVNNSSILYVVPSATIRLFSPQVYINNNSTACLVLDSTGLQFTLKCGMGLHFPISKVNSLLFILTQAFFDKRRKPSSNFNSSQQLEQKSTH